MPKELIDSVLDETIDSKLNHTREIFQFARRMSNRRLIRSFLLHSSLDYVSLCMCVDSTLSWLKYGRASKRERGKSKGRGVFVSMLWSSNRVPTKHKYSTLHRSRLLPADEGLKRLAREWRPLSLFPRCLCVCVCVSV